MECSDEVKPDETGAASPSHAQQHRMSQHSPSPGPGVQLHMPSPLKPQRVHGELITQNHVSGGGVGPARSGSKPRRASTARRGSEQMDVGPSPTAATAARGITAADIQHVQNMIESCLQYHLGRDETLGFMHQQASEGSVSFC